MKGNILGCDKDEVKMAKFLGRAITCEDCGISYNDDSRHVDVLIDEWGMSGCKIVTSPGCETEKESEDKPETKED